MRLSRHWLRAGLGAFIAAVCASITGAYQDAPKAEAGKAAPAFDLPATQISKVLPDKKDAKTISLKDFEGKRNVVLFFFPKAMTRG